jgi:hypothetical protein
VLFNHIVSSSASTPTTILSIPVCILTHTIIIIKIKVKFILGFDQQHHR